MKTNTETEPAFITIPAIGGCQNYIVDPLNRALVRSLIERADAYFRLSAKAWEAANQSGQSKDHYERCSRREQSNADNGAALLAPLGIKCDWPGLYPSFEVGGYHEYTTQAAVLAALKLPRNFLA